MTFEEQLNEISELWSKNPFNDDFINDPGNKKMCTVEGITEQINNLPSGPGKIIAAILNDDQQIEIKTIEIFKQ